MIEIPDNDVIDERREREFTLTILSTSYFGSYLSINPQTLRVIIKDNDTGEFYISSYKKLSLQNVTQLSLWK